MLQKLSGSNKEDICPNCGEACFATETFCPRCGKNLDDLFEQLPLDSPKAKPIIPLAKEQKLLIKWVFATSIGFVLGKVFLSPFAFSFVPASLLENEFDLFGIMLGVASGIVTGLSVGTLQSLIMKNYIPRSWMWIIGTLLGMTGGSFVEGIIIVIARNYLPTGTATAIWAVTAWTGFFINGVAIGLIQWIVLRRSFLKTWTWVVTNGFGWALATTIGDELFRPSYYGFGCVGFVDYVLIEGTTGILIGIITGLLLLWLVRQNKILNQNAA